MRYPSLVSTTEPTVQRTVQPRTILTPAARSAVVAAVAAGMTKTEAAQQFAIHRNTVTEICKEVSQLAHPANPLSEHWKPTMKQDAIAAVTAGLRASRDPYKAANIGVKVLEGIGEFVSGSHVDVDASVAIQVSWLPAQDAQCIDVTPQVVDNTQDQT